MEIKITITIKDKPVHSFGRKTMAVNLMMMLIFAIKFIFAFPMILHLLEASMMCYVK